MSQFSPESPYDPPAQPFGSGAGEAKVGNGMAIASLVCGLLGCIPFLTSLLAVVFGIVGLNKTKNPRVGGKGLSIAGIILGVLGIGGWGVVSLITISAGPMIRAGIEAATLPQEFLKNLSAGNVDAASEMTTGGDKEAIKASIEEVKPWGAFKAFQPMGNTTRADNNQAEVEMTGQATYEKQTKSVGIVLVNTGDPKDLKKMKFKIKSWSFK